MCLPMYIFSTRKCGIEKALPARFLSLFAEEDKLRKRGHVKEKNVASLQGDLQF